MAISSDNRVLFFAISGLGDNLFAIPALMELEARTRLTLVVPAGPQEKLFQTLLPHTRIVPFTNTIGSLLSILRVGIGFDYWLYSIGSSFRKPRLLNLLSLARQRYAFTSLSSQKTWQYELGFDYCLTPDLGKKSWQNSFRLLTLMDANFLKDMKPWDHYAAIARARMTATVTPLPVKPKRLFIHAGCNKYTGGLEKYKRWPTSRYIETATELIRRQRIEEAYFFVGPAEVDVATEVTEWKNRHPSTPIHIWDASTHNNDLLTTARLFIESGCYLGNDSGMAHLAAVLAIPTVVVMSGISQPSFTSPDGQASSIVVHPVPCQGCTVGISTDMALKFVCPNSWACMENIRVLDVLNHFELKCPI